MPRNESGVYSKPANTTASPNTTIQSALFNSVIDDLVSDANAARPISAGGTGATNATEAQENLGIDHLVGAAPEVSAALALDNIDNPGWVYVASANCTTVGGPTGGGDGFVETGYTSAKRYQVYHPVNSALSPWRRVYTANAWTSWLQDLTSGTGSSGFYERWRSGLQICYREQLTLPEASTTHCEATWTLPIAFVNTNYVVEATLRPPTDGGSDIAANCTPTQSAILHPYPHTKTTTSVVIRCHRVTGGTDFDNGDELYVDLKATGRWV